MTADAAFSRILVPTDFSAGSEQALSTAQRLASALGSELVLVHVLVDAPLFFEGAPFTAERVREVYSAAREWAEDQIERWAARGRAAGLKVRTSIRVGVPHTEIVAAADEHATLVVLATHGRGGIDRALLGSVADRVIRRAPCPVVSVREVQEAG